MNRIKKNYSHTLDPIEDTACVTAFIEKNMADFELWLEDYAMSEEYRQELEKDYCTDNKIQFRNFAERFYEDKEESDAEFTREANENR